MSMMLRRDKKNPYVLRRLVAFAKLLASLAWLFYEWARLELLLLTSRSARTVLHERIGMQPNVAIQAQTERLVEELRTRYPQQ